MQREREREREREMEGRERCRLEEEKYNIILSSEVYIDLRLVPGDNLEIDFWLHGVKLHVKAFKLAI